MTRGFLAGRTAVFAVFGGGLAFVVSLVLMVVGSDFEPRLDAGANTFSRSAIGHRAFAELLRRLDVPVVISRFETAERLGESSLLVVAEPRSGNSGTGLAELLGLGRATLYVLPKWHGIPDRFDPGWLDSATPISHEIVKAELLVAQTSHGGFHGRIVRAEGPVEWLENDIGYLPDISEPQLIESDDLHPIVASAAGLLVGELRQDGQILWVLSDPDLISNHGLGRGENAALAFALIEALRPAGGSVVFDETHHGFVHNPNLLASAFQAPYWMVTAQIALAVAVLVWAAATSMGAPLPRPRPQRAAGPQFTEHAARLVVQAGHQGPLLERYLHTAIRDAARKLHAPANLSEAESLSWLDRIGRSRGAPGSLPALVADVHAAGRGPTRLGSEQLLHLARRIDEWKRSLIHGS